MDKHENDKTTDRLAVDSASAGSQKDMALEFLRERFPFPNELTSEEELDKWYFRYGLLSAFEQYLNANAKVKS